MDIVDRIVRMPGHGVRLSDETGDAIAAFFRAIEMDRDADTACGVALGLVILSLRLRRSANPRSVISHANRIATDVYHEWDRR